MTFVTGVKPKLLYAETDQIEQKGINYLFAIIYYHDILLTTVEYFTGLQTQNTICRILSITTIVFIFEKWWVGAIKTENGAF